MLADSHLGFDLAMRPRVRRRRRGRDFLANHQRALQPALRGDVDVVVHGGDLFHRPHVPASLVHQAFEPIHRVAERGVPVLIVPGNHERSRIPHARFAFRSGVHVFDRPRSFHIERRGLRVSFAGFPFSRRDLRANFTRLVGASAAFDHPADVRLLCMHQTVEGATVGPGDFTFRRGGDVIRGRDIPNRFAAVLSGHIHRHQVLKLDLAGRSLGAPVLYPGSIDRTSIAEVEEPKGYVLLEVAAGAKGGRLAGWKFVRLDARPMIVRHLGSEDRRSPEAIDLWLKDVIREAPDDAILRLRVQGELPRGGHELFAAAQLRRRAPPTMNLDVVMRDGSGLRRRLRPVSAASEAQTRLPL